MYNGKIFLFIGKVVLEFIWSGNFSNVSWVGNFVKLVGEIFCGMMFNC